MRNLTLDTWFVTTAQSVWNRRNLCKASMRTNAVASISMLKPRIIHKLPQSYFMQTAIFVTHIARFSVCPHGRSHDHRARACLPLLRLSLRLFTITLQTYTDMLLATCVPLTAGMSRLPCGINHHHWAPEHRSRQQTRDNVPTFALKTRPQGRDRRPVCCLALQLALHYKRRRRWCGLMMLDTVHWNKQPSDFVFLVSFAVLHCDGVPTERTTAVGFYIEFVLYMLRGTHHPSIQHQRRRRRAHHSAQNKHNNNYTTHTQAWCRQNVNNGPAAANLDHKLGTIRQTRYVGSDDLRGEYYKNALFAFDSDADGWLVGWLNKNESHAIVRPGDICKVRCKVRQRFRPCQDLSTNKQPLYERGTTLSTQCALRYSMKSPILQVPIKWFSCAISLRLIWGYVFR